MSDNKMTPGGIGFGPGADSPAWFKQLIAEIPHVRSDRYEAAQIEARLKRRIATLEARLAWTLMQCETYRVALFKACDLPPGERGSVWSRRRSPKGGR
jgi:hypothetical protein